jgi:hypothetical protein
MDKLRTCKHSTSSKSLRLKKQPAAGCLEDQMEVHSASLKNFVGTYDPTIENKKFHLLLNSRDRLQTILGVLSNLKRIS